VAGKVPSALEIFNDTASFNNTNTYSPAPATAPPIQRMTNLWADCFNNQPYAICGRIRDVNALLLGNYQNYVNVYNKSLNGDKTWSETWGCTKPGGDADRADRVPVASLWLEPLGSRCRLQV
jgi:hypothetical protein